MLFMQGNDRRPTGGTEIPCAIYATLIPSALPPEVSYSRLFVYSSNENAYMSHVLSTLARSQTLYKKKIKKKIKVKQH